MADFLTKIENQVLTITFNKADKRNAFTFDMMSEIARIIRSASEDDSIRCIVITGDGEYFCSGYDLSGGSSSFSTKEAVVLQNQDPKAITESFPAGQFLLALYESNKPLIAAINGPGVGIGATMILPMDFRLMSNTAKLGYVFTRRGLVQEFASSWMLPRVVGLTKATDWILSGRYIDAQEAMVSGLVTKVCKPEELLPEAYAIAGDLVEKTSAIAVATARRLLWSAAAEPDINRVNVNESSCFFELASGPEAAEGIRSFLEKRPPQFPGKVSRDLPSLIKQWQKR